MTRTLELNVPFLTRVEGHGHIVVDVTAGQVTTCQLQIVETPRLFERLLVGRSVFEAQHLTSRICGICACAHSLASIAAAEAALGFTPSAQTVALRRLLLQLENLDSHILHAGLLVPPDLLGAQSFLGLLPRHKALVQGVLRMKQQCNRACALLVGRHVHPIAAVVGGFTKLPGVAELEQMHTLLTGVRADLEPLLELYAAQPLPAFNRPTEYVALLGSGSDYPVSGALIGSSDGVRQPVESYRVVTNEYAVAHSTARHARLSRSSYAVGALARYNLNHAGLGSRAFAVAEQLGLQPGCANPFFNTLAQLVECVQHVDGALAGLEALLKTGIDPAERVEVGVHGNSGVTVQAGTGVGAVEAPRGLLLHDYTVDAQGRITAANCVIPTGQNLHNIEDDLRQRVLELLDRSEEEIVLDLEMLVRAYDPCISCSTHFLKVDLVNR